MRISTKKYSAFTAPDTCIHHSVIHYDIQPVNKAAEHLINSTPVLERKKQKKRAVNAYLIKNSKEGRDAGGGGVLSQAVGRIGRSIMSQSILCNYFKVCTKFTLEAAE